MNGSKSAGYIYIIFAVSAWGSLYVAGKIVLDYLPVTVLLSLRYIIGLSTLLFVSRRMKMDKILKEDRKYIFLIGGIAYYLAVSLQLLGNYLSEASLSSLLNSINPILTVLFAALLLKEALTTRKLASVALTILGAIIIIGGVSRGDLLGVAVNLGSVTAWSYGSIIMRKACTKYDALSVTIYSMAFGLLLALPTSMAELYVTKFSFTGIPLSVILLVLFIGIVCTAAALYSWNKGLSIIDAGTSSLFLPLQPVVSSVLGIFILGETLTINFILGSSLVLMGILYSVAPVKIKQINTKESLNTSL